MSPHTNETPHDRTRTADPTGVDRRDPVTDRSRATLDIPAEWPSPVAREISTAVAARVTGRWTGPQFDALLEHVDDCAVFVLDEHGHVRTWDDRAETLTGYASDEVIGRHVSLLYPDVVAEAGVPDRELRAAAEDGGNASEGWRVREDGSVFRAETTIRPLRGGDDLTGFVNVMQDVTDDRHARELGERCATLEDLVTATSHDLRGPLAVAAANVELAAEADDGTHLDAIGRALDRVEELLDRLTTLVEKGEWVQEADTVELCEVAEAAWDVTETDGAALSTRGEVTVPADRCRVQELLENLFKNAVEHSSTNPPSQAHEDAVEHSSTNPPSKAHEDAVEHGTTDGGESCGSPSDVSVRVGPLPEARGFYVADDGPGIPHETHEAVFESGYTTAEEGTGFGLAIVRTITEAHGWSVDLTDSDEGGARFEFRTDGI